MGIKKIYRSFRPIVSFHRFRETFSFLSRSVRTKGNSQGKGREANGRDFHALAKRRSKREKKRKKKTKVEEKRNGRKKKGVAISPFV